MNESQYRLLLDLAETGNITRTAGRLGYSQPGASHILKKIEEELGFSIVYREKYGVRMTQEMELLLPRIREILTAHEKLQQTIYQIKGLEYGTVTIGAYSSIASNLLPYVLKSFRSNHPGITIDIREGGAEEILQWLEQDIIDFALISRTYASSLEFNPIGKDPLVAVLPDSYDTKGRKAIPIGEFEGVPFVISAAGNDYDIHHTLEVSGVQPDFYYSALDDPTILSMVEKGLGVSILTELICAKTGYHVVTLPIEPEYHRELGIGKKPKKPLSPAAETFENYSIPKLRELINSKR